MSKVTYYPEKSIIQTLARSEGLTQEQVKSLVRQYISEISKALIAGDAVRISSFGTFSTKEQKARKVTLPSGEEASIPAYRKAKFRASSELCALLTEKKGS